MSLPPSPSAEKRERSWSPLLLIIGLVFQVVILFLILFLALAVPSLTSAMVSTAGDAVGTMAWLGAVSSLLAAWLSVFIVRSRPASTPRLLVHLVVPALLVSVGNAVSTVSVRGWIGVMMIVLFSVVGAVIGGATFVAFRGSKR